MLYTATTFKLVFDYQPSDVYWCTADIGWITGHSYITYGPLANGATSVLVREGGKSHFKHMNVCMRSTFVLVNMVKGDFTENKNAKDNFSRLLYKS